MIKAATASGARTWSCPLTASQVRAILDGAGRWGVCCSRLRTNAGAVYLEVTCSAGIDHADAVVSRRAPVLVGGTAVAVLEATGPAPIQPALDQAVQSTALRLAEAWAGADELNNLASEIVHAYEELHLLYDVAETLTGQLSVASAADLILERTLRTLQASWAELRLTSPSAPVFVRSTQPAKQARGTRSGRQLRLSTVLRSGGQIVGELSLARPAAHEAFSSADSKLLDAVGTLAGKAIHNAELYEELQRQAEALRGRETYLRAVMDNVAEGIVTVDAEGFVQSFNPAAERLFDYSFDEMIGRPFRVLLADRQGVANGSLSSYHVDLVDGQRTTSTPKLTTGKRSDGATFPMEMTVSEMRFDAQQRFIISMRDIAERKQWEEALEHQALYDALTDLPNRSLLRDRLQQAVQATQRDGGHFALLVMDLDRFKDVNDTFGHHYGDLLLQQIGPRLRTSLREDATIARLGGDEFAVILSTTGDVFGASLIAGQLLRALERPFLVAGRSFNVGASIGIAVCPSQGQDPDTLLRRADIAMYVAKRSHKGYAVFSDQDERNARRVGLLGQLHTAIEQEQLVLHYQPTVDLRTGRIDRVEALVRWRHPELGLLPPDLFIPLAEQTGLIGSLSHWVLNAALRQMRAWHDQGHMLSVAVNLSTQNLHDPKLPQSIAALLKQWNVAATWLKVEITESMLMADPAQAMEVLTRLRTIGVHVAIDDFGTGYSSLAYLKRLPVDELKIDKSFVLQMTTSSSDAAIVRSAINLSHDLELMVVAEGVENQATWELLRNFQCDMTQGYYLSHPMPPAELSTWLNDYCATPGNFIAVADREQGDGSPYA